MKIQITEILNFTDFYASVKDKKMSIMTAYKLTKLAAAVDTEINFYREKLQSIIEEFSQKDDNGNYMSTEDGSGVKIIEGKEEECGKAMFELQSLEIELPDITFGISEFESVEITPDDFINIMPFIKD